MEFNCIDWFLLPSNCNLIILSLLCVCVFDWTKRYCTMMIIETKQINRTKKCLQGKI